MRSLPILLCGRHSETLVAGLSGSQVSQLAVLVGAIAVTLIGCVLLARWMFHV